VKSWILKPLLFTNSNVYRYREFIPKDAVTELEEVAETGGMSPGMGAGRLSESGGLVQLRRDSSGRR
jgi:hypothetical protein